ncbi:LuxR C-terminal-related transcriptional regulator [Microbacterium sp. SSW1-49]|uniref:LuxR C-terminal-related transcriptional regulator n=1 Tax=Microbacterium croceum TaxID=2851645 RepID=A0ABT0FA14_9MICO|nr:LuxR C-terminal-related transcriptional regulator [Microbacterium croceum]MCK2034562.1 LuxR C-terminal-related transcriptional regulator [Microbacterium croceum]
MVVCVGIIDDHRAMLLGTTAIVNGHPGLHVVAVGKTVAELVAFRQRMDVILLGLTLSDGSTPAQNIAALAWTGARVLAYVGDEQIGLIREAARAGAVGMVKKSDEAPQLVATVRAAARGQLAASADWAARIGRGESEAARVNLSTREGEVLALYAAGETAERVAQALFVSRETVLDHIRRIRVKYAAVGRPALTKVDLFRRAVEDGFVQQDP